MRKEALVVIAITIFGMIYYYSQDNQSSFQKSKAVIENEIEATVSDKSSVNEDQEKAVVASTDGASTTEVNPPIDANNSATVEPVQKLFAQHLKAMSQCLQIKNQADQEQLEPSLDQLFQSLKPAFGDVSVLTDDWTQTDLKYSDGMTRRIRTEISYENPSNPTKYLYVYRINEQGLPELEPISEEQSQNPSDEYILSLEAGSDATLKEKGGRAYFTGGEELIIIEKNAKLDSFTLTKNNKTFSCNSMTSLESNCQCF
jgi:hypothetical protein